MELTQEYLISILEYNPDTGLFTRKYRPDRRKCWNTRYANKPAGTLNNLGYIEIHIDGSRHAAHRLAFLYMTGSIPPIIDHIDRKRDNNKWSNLREATTSQNSANKLKQSNNTSQYKNITWHAASNKWQVSVRKDGKTIYGGIYTDLKEAVNIANTLRAELFGQFALYEEFKE